MQSRIAGLEEGIGLLGRGSPSRMSEWSTPHENLTTGVFAIGVSECTYALGFRSRSPLQYCIILVTLETASVTLYFEPLGCGFEECVAEL